MSLSQHPKAYGSAALAAAFVAGILLTLGFKDIYPDLERRYQRAWKKHASTSDISTPPNPATNDSRRRSIFSWGTGPVSLEDHDGHELRATSVQQSPSPATSVQDLIGHTPLLRILSLSDATGRNILAKCEFLNGAGGSPKDRVALSIILAAEASDQLVPGRGDTIYEGTVGSTGISLAVLARARGYRAHICMPEDQSIEKSRFLEALGATVERVPLAPITSPEHFVNLARRRAAEHTADDGTESRGYFADQFENEANWKAHFETTGPEIWEQTGGKIDAFVAGSGTGGTISGVAKYLKDPARGKGVAERIKVALADPEGSGLYNKVKHGVMYSHTEREGTRRRQQVDTIIEGVGLTRTTHNFEAGRELVDDAVKVTDDQACRMARWLVEHDGIFAGSSSAVNCVAAVETAMSLPEGSTVVTILCDSGQRHLSRFYKRVAELEADGVENSADIWSAVGFKRPLR